jgi:hypothetical protein
VHPPASSHSSELQSLRDQISSLRSELQRAESKLAHKDATLAKAQAAFLSATQGKFAEHARQRAALAEARQATVEAEARLQHVQRDLSLQKEKECSAMQAHGAQAVQAHQAVIESVTQMIRNSSTSRQPPVVGLQSSSPPSNHAQAFAPGFGGAAAGLSHEEHLKSVLTAFQAERSAWDRSRAAEIASLKEEHAVAISTLEARLQKTKASYNAAQASWTKQHRLQEREISVLASYAQKLTYLLEEIDRGQYPVCEKHGIRAFSLPAHRRTFLAVEAAEQSALVSGQLQARMEELRAAFTRVGIPWNPNDLAKPSSSFLHDRKQLQLRETQQRLLEADSDGELAPQEAQQRLTNGSSEVDEKEETRSSDLREQERAALEASLLNELSSHQTVAYIQSLEAERDRLRAQLARETKHNLELHRSLASQSRVLATSSGASSQRSSSALHTEEDTESAPTPRSDRRPASALLPTRSLPAQPPQIYPHSTTASIAGGNSRPISAQSASQKSRPTSAFSATSHSHTTATSETANGGVLQAALHSNHTSSHFPKPSPLHLTVGNAPAQVFAHQLAKHAHSASEDVRTSTRVRPGSAARSRPHVHASVILAQ